MNKSKTVIKNSLKFWNRLREIQASQPTEHNFCPHLNLLQDTYYKKYIQNLSIQENKKEDKDDKLTQ